MLHRLNNTKKSTKFSSGVEPGSLEPSKSESKSTILRLRPLSHNSACNITVLIDGECCTRRKICWNSLVTICNFDLENIGQSSRVRLSQWFHSMSNVTVYNSRSWQFWISTNFVVVPFGGKAANINIYKSHITHFRTSSHRFPYINIYSIWPWKSRSRSQTIITANNAIWSHILLVVSKWDKYFVFVLRKLYYSIPIYVLITSDEAMA